MYGQVFKVSWSNADQSIKKCNLWVLIRSGSYLTRLEGGATNIFYVMDHAEIHQGLHHLSSFLCTIWLKKQLDHKSLAGINLCQALWNRPTVKWGSSQ